MHQTINRNPTKQHVRVQAKSGTARTMRGGVLFFALVLATLAIFGRSSSTAQSDGSARKPVSLADLPNLVRAYGQKRQAQVATATGASAVGTKGFALTETDLTAGNISDEREPVFRQSGDFIAFVSNGADNVNNVSGASVPDGRLDPNVAQADYHVWIMSRTGTNARQVTGLGVDKSLTQRRPAWSPDGNRLVYVQGTGVEAQLFFVSPFSVDGATGKPPIQQITFFRGEKRSPAWGPSGAIAFSTNVIPAVNGTTTPTPNNNFDIFAVDSTGNLATLRRLTGGPTDALGDQTDDLNPAFSLVNVGVVFFSSNRAAGVKINGRRIWSMGAADGSTKRQITDTKAQQGGYESDVDDNPSPSLTQNFPGGVTFTERIAFERGRRIDTSDTVRDANIWTIPVDSSALAPQPSPPAAAITVAAFNGNRVRDYNLVDGGLRRELTSFLLNNPEDIIYGPDLTGDGYPDLLVANRNRGAGTVELFDGLNGAFVSTKVVGSVVGGGLTNPTGMTIGPDGALYIASGNSDVQASANRVFRISLLFGGTTSFPFTTGGGITDGIEGITFGPDADGDRFTDLYVASLNPSKIAVFNGFSGNFIRDFVPVNSGGLAVPTGITFSSDINGDRTPELYVCSSGDDTVKIYDGATGNFITTLVNDANLINPERILMGRDFNRDGIRDILVTAFGFGGFGSTVNRYDGRTGAPMPAPGKTGAIFISDGALTGPSGITLNPVASGAFIPTTPSSAPLESVTNPATLETNQISSPASLARVRYQGATEDFSADREPAFAKSDATARTIAQVAFASQRRTANAPSGIPTNPVPTVVNPAGGPQFVLGTNRPTNAAHDIWVTNSNLDLTPPILLPVAVGGQLYPALSPGEQAPFTAPRTAEEGLLPGSKITVAFVVQDLESGLRTASVSFKDADRPTFNFRPSGVNTLFPAVDVADEDQPATVSSVRPGTTKPLSLRIYDDGPLTSGGHERQPAAIGGDGTYYCEGSFATVDDSGLALNGDYYVDLSVNDNSGNAFVYDNVFGFSTKIFAKNNPVLFVSDYTVGQTFTSQLLAAPRAFIATDPVESYFLTNPGGTFNLGSPFEPHNIPQDLAFLDYFFNEDPADTTSLGSQQVDPITGRTEFVDTWRILCRGPVPLDTMRLYSPQITEQLQPGDPDGDGIPGPYTDANGVDITRRASVVSSCMVWASPYTGDVFAAPGTLFDGASQRDITEYLKTGGRLFITGQEILFALSNNRTVTNAFLRDELKANFGGETGTLNTIAGAGFRGATTLPIRPGLLGGPLFNDAAGNQAGFDIITPIAAAANETVATLYSGGGGVLGQRIEKRNRLNGLDSKVVFFSFGYETIHRNYLVQGATRPPFHRCQNIRSKLFYSMVHDYFYTGGLSGKVISSATNQPIPNFIIQITGPNGESVARTNQNGEYEIIGLPEGGYNVRPAEYTDANGVLRSANGSFFPGLALAVNVQGGANTRDVNFRVQPAPPGGISGRAISDKNTVDPADDGIPSITPAINVPVLVRSLRKLPASASFPQGGTFAAMVSTDNAGNFTIHNVPANEHYELIFNPRPGLTTDPDPTKRGDIPPNSGVVYPNPDTTSQPQPNVNFGRRIIPVDANYGRDFTHTAIQNVADDTGTLRDAFVVNIGEDLALGDVPIPPGTGPGGGGGGGGGGTGSDDFQIGAVYMISIPWMDSTSSSSTTTAAKAFTLPPTATDGTVNYRLTKFDPLTQKYVTLTNTATLIRGEGYFMRPVGKTVSFVRPPNGVPLRAPLSAGITQFTVTLRRSSSISPTDPNNGFNLIGFPFNPDTFHSSNWNVAKVVIPATGATYTSLTQAVAAGVLSGNLQKLADISGTTYANTTKLVPLGGYFAKTYVDNVQVTLVASTSP